MNVVFLRKSTVVVNRETVQSIDVRVEGHEFRCYQLFDNKEWNFTAPGFVERNPAVAAMIIDGGCLPPYDEWEQMKDAIRPFLG